MNGFDLTKIIVCIAIMAAVTYLPRVLPIAIFRKRIENRTVRSFLAYMPYAALSAMTFPEILYSTGNFVSGLTGALVALLLAFFKRSLLTVAVAGAAAALITEYFLCFFL